MTSTPVTITRIVVTGAAGWVGRKFVARLADRDDVDLVATDVRATDVGNTVDGCLVLDVRDAGAVRDAIHGADVVVHLAAIVDPPSGMTRETQREIDVGGTHHVLDACLEHGVGRLVVTSSGAAYGYHPDHPRWIGEDMPLRAGEAFAYAWHKRLVEELLARARRDHPALEQVVLRVSSVLGDGLDNLITRLFDRRRLLTIRGGDDRFVFVWDEDLARVLERAALGPGAVTGVFNVCGDGALSMTEIARRLRKPLLRLPAAPTRAALALLRPLRLSRYGPEQVRFLRYRPVLDNTRLKRDFGYTPEKTSAQAFDAFLACRKDPS